jgi:hypothetical protein
LQADYGNVWQGLESHFAPPRKRASRARRRVRR